MTYSTNTAENLDDFDFGCNLSEVEDTSEYTPIPAGDYLVAATQITLDDNRARTGKIIKVTFTVTEGNYAGRMIFENFNVQNPNPKAVSIALQNIKAWCIACGLTGNEHLTMGMVRGLMGQEFLATVKIDPAKNGYDAQNRIKKFAKLSGTQAAPVATHLTPAPASVSQPVSASTAPAPAAGKKPWEM